jgi:hypothetical protein
MWFSPAKNFPYHKHPAEDAQTVFLLGRAWEERKEKAKKIG